MCATDANPSNGPADRKTYSCYCGIWDTNPKFYEDQGIPRGYCGFCQVCGKPGHTQHYPGPVPYTGCWCDACLKRVKWWGGPTLLQYLLVALVIGFALFQVWRLITR